ncbi:MAG TPA: class II aldolase/adducin family protein [Stellaceae bacterium]|jgi:L-fuculose-phosphate aldolase|nr:class II aldolase/adducin family protein [Stellaceae bacterium]
MDAGEAKRQLIDAGKILAFEGQGDLTRGHVSARVPGDPAHFFMKPHSFGLDEITMDNIVVCNLEGEKVGGGGRRHSEVFIHSEIFRARPDVNSVIHTHPLHAVALSATGKNLAPVSQPAAPFYDGLPYYTDTIDLIRNQDQGAGVARALAGHKAVLMRHHGVAVVGASIAEAVVLAILLDQACRIQLMAEAGGGLGPLFPHDDIMRLHRNSTHPEQYAVNFDYLRRKAQALSPRW